MNITFSVGTLKRQSIIVTIHEVFGSVVVCLVRTTRQQCLPLMRARLRVVVHCTSNIAR